MPNIPQIKIGNTIYNVKDAALSDEVNLICESGTEYIQEMYEQKMLTNKWVIGNLNANGVLSTSTKRRISTFNFMRSEFPIELNDTSGTLHFIVCTYTDAKVLASRTATSSVPANTFFKVTAYGDESADLNDASELSKYITYTNRDYVREENTSVQIANELNSMREIGRRPLPSDFIIGNLNAEGSLDVNMNSRVVFTDYMLYDHKIAIEKKSNDYGLVLCTYNSDYTLKNRSVYTNYNITHINKNTLFRIAIYNVSDDMNSVPVSNPFDLVKCVWISEPAVSTKTDADYIALFESFAVIGDSLSAGFVSNGSGSSYTSNQARIAGRNWPSYLGLRIGRSVTNLAKGSSTAHDWRYGNSELDVDISTADIDTYCYMVAIGVNDSRQSLTVGSSSDINTDKDLNSDTFYGNYDWMIRKLIEYKTARVAQAKIFVFTLPPTESTAENYNEAIRYIASLYDNVYCIDLYNIYYNQFFESPLSELWVGSHSRPMGYMLMSNMIRSAVNDYMKNNIAEFSYAPWLPLE